jgi:hypothetical protein
MVLSLVEYVSRSLVLREAAVFASSAAQSSGLAANPNVIMSAVRSAIVRVQK